MGSKTERAPFYVIGSTVETFFEAVPSGCLMSGPKSPLPTVLRMATNGVPDRKPWERAEPGRQISGDMPTHPGFGKQAPK